MKAMSCGMFLGAALAMADLASAEVPAGAPAGATGLCRDGSFTDHAIKIGACSGHKGVKTWYAAVVAAPVPATRTVESAVVNGATPSAARAPTSSEQTVASASGPAAAENSPPAGGAGQVWANAGSMVYHCFGTQYYGKTKSGSYMSEAEAKVAGYHANRGKGCS